MSFEDIRFSSTANVLKDNGKNVKDPKMVGSLGKIPNWKTIDFYMGNYELSDAGAYSGRGVNWRKVNLCGINFSKNPVNENVLLIPERDNLLIKGGVSYSEVNEEVGSSGGLLDVIKGAAEIFSGSTFKPAWSAKTFNDLNSLTVDGEYEFKFKFGNAGLYNAFEEVIKPILALTVYFGIEDCSNDDSTMANAANQLISPMPTKGQFLAEKVGGILQTAKSGLSGQFKSNDGEGGSSSPSASALETANRVIQTAISSGARNIAIGNKFRNLYMSWGRLVIGPLIYKNYEYSLNMNELDAYGWPIEGSFKISGLESLRKSTSKAMISPFVKRI